MNTAYAVRSEMTVVDFLQLLQRHKWIVIGATAVCIIAAAAYAIIKTPVYSATVVLMPAKMEGESGLSGRLPGGLGGLMSLANLNVGSGTDKQEALAVLKSRHFTEEFIKEKNLLPVLYADAWDTNKQAWADPERVPTLGAAFRRFDRKVRFVREDRDTGLITLEILWHDREQAAQWANELIIRLNRNMRDMAIEEAERSLQYLDEQLKNTDVVGLRQAIFGLMERNINRIMLANIRDEFAFKVVDPAVVPDGSNVVSPRPVLNLAIGTILGIMLGVILAVLRSIWLQSKTLAVSASSGS